MKVCGVIMAGGFGERFWPLSRKDTPKQLLNLTGRGPLALEAAERLVPLTGKENLFAVTGERHAGKLRDALRPALPPENVLCEPAARGTAACIGYSAILLERLYGRDAVMIVTPADAYIEDGEKFIKTLSSAVSAAESGALVTIGVKPTFPATGYGYLCVEEGFAPVMRVEKFTEKPSRAQAEEFLKSGRYLWNSGMFVWKIGAILSAIQKYLPDTYEILQKIKENFGNAEETARLYLEISPISVDYGVMEKADNILAALGEFGWSDVGSFDMLSAIKKADEDANVCVGESYLLKSQGCVIYSPKKPVAGVGIHDLIVVETDDVLLVCPKDRAQEIKNIVQKLRSAGREDLL